MILRKCTMSIALPLALALTALAGARADAQGCSPSATAAVTRLLKVSMQRETMELAIATMTKGMAAQAPSAMQGVMKDFMQEELSWDKVEPDFRRVYCETYTEKEMADLSTFYESPTGQLLLRKTPMIMQKTQELTAARMQTAMPKLMARMQEAMTGTVKKDTLRAPR